jgi:CHAT domain-containing protein
MVGLVHLERADAVGAVEFFRQALTVFEKTNEIGHQGAVLSLLANALDFVDAGGEAWHYHYLALKFMARAGDAQRLQVIYGATARALSKRGQPAAALAFQDEGLGLALRSRRPLECAEAFWWRAMILLQMGKAERAIQDIHRARLSADGITHKPTRDRTLAGIMVTEGGALRLHAPEEAVKILTKAFKLYRQSEYSYLLLDIYLERARAFRLLYQSNAAAADLLSAINILEQQRQRVTDPRLRLLYFDRAEKVFDEMVALEIDDRNDIRTALEFTERSRARDLRDAVHCSGLAAASCLGEPVDLSEILSHIPRGTALFEYHILPDRCLVWLLRDGRTVLHELSIERSTLESLVESLLDALQKEDDSEGRLLETSSRLFELLVRPILASAGGVNRLVIVPDKILARLPYGALFDSATGTFLTERFPLAIAPSSMIYAMVTASVPARSPSDSWTSLAIGNPKFDRIAYPGLRSLPEAEKEAANLAQKGAGSVLLTGADATVRRFLREVNSHELIHFAGHAQIYTLSPGQSRLLFAAGPKRGEQSELLADQIRQLRLTRPRLVVLSACNSGRGPYHSLEGVSDMARPFVAAGVPAVLTSLWQVDDTSSRFFWGIFYEELFSSFDPSLALQKAQLTMIRSSEGKLRMPRAWAGFQMVGTFGGHNEQKERKRCRTSG